MGRLEYICTIEGLDRIIYDDLASWANSSFLQDNTNSGTLRIWRNGLCTLEDINRANDEIKADIGGFTLYLENRINRTLTVSLNIIPPEFPDGNGNSAIISQAMRIGDQVAADPKLCAPPSEMPSLPPQVAYLVRLRSEKIKCPRCIEDHLRNR